MHQNGHYQVKPTTTDRNCSMQPGRFIYRVGHAHYISTIS